MPTLNSPELSFCRSHRAKASTKKSKKVAVVLVKSLPTTFFKALIKNFQALFIVLFLSNHRIPALGYLFFFRLVLFLCLSSWFFSGEHHAFVDFDADVFGNLKHDDVAFYFFDFAIDAPLGYDFSTFLECVLELLDLFLTFGLWANHEEIKYDENKDDHQDALPATCLACCSLQ